MPLTMCLLLINLLCWLFAVVLVVSCSWCGKCVSHYENLPMQYTEFFKMQKLKKKKKNGKILIFAQNIHCGHMLEASLRGGCNEYPQCMFWIKNKKIRYVTANPSFSI